MEPEGSLPHSQESTTCAYPNSDYQSPRARNPRPEDPF